MGRKNILDRRTEKRYHENTGKPFQRGCHG
nr:MAG TPA: hypothetical protein [Caudoviricetes sp.]